MIVYQCEDSLEGIFTAIYRAYEEKRDHTDTRIALTEELVLFAEYITVQPEVEKAWKVTRSLHRIFGEQDFELLCAALYSENEEKAQAVYQTIVYGLQSKSSPGHLFDNLPNGSVNKTFKLARAANNESHHLKGFVRFQELENGILFSKIGPKNNVLNMLMPHFADRFPMENFMIVDEKRDLYGVHPAGKEWYFVHGSEFFEDNDLLKLSNEEMKYQELFAYFCHKISIKERENIKLQRNMLPLRYQEYMVEFDNIRQNN